MVIINLNKIYGRTIVVRILPKITFNQDEHLSNIDLSRLSFRVCINSSFYHFQILLAFYKILLYNVVFKTFEGENNNSSIDMDLVHPELS